MKPRFIILILLLASAAAATVWRIQNPRQRDPNSVRLADRRPAPPFQLLDQQNRPVQLAGYLNRFRVLLYFFDATAGLESDPVLSRLRETNRDLRRAGIVVVAVSTPLTPEQKTAASDYPFPIVRDTLAGQPGSSSNVWGRTTPPKDSQSIAVVKPGMFLIDQLGFVAWEGSAPKPEPAPLEMIATLLDGG